VLRNATNPVQNTKSTVAASISPRSINCVQDVRTQIWNRDPELVRTNAAAEQRKTNDCGACKILAHRHTGIQKGKPCTSDVNKDLGQGQGLSARGHGPTSSLTKKQQVT